jgi:uncharacterized protein
MHARSHEAKKIGYAPHTSTFNVCIFAGEIKMAGTFEIKTTKGGKFHFVLKAGNGQVILSSQQYTSHESAINGVESVKKHAKKDASFERKSDKSGAPFFVLNADNGQVIGQSEMYSSNSAMENGIDSVMKNAPAAKLNDTTAE